jgi:hypothetical protein
MVDFGSECVNIRPCNSWGSKFYYVHPFRGLVELYQPDSRIHHLVEEVGGKVIIATSKASARGLVNRQVGVHPMTLIILL